MTPASLLALLVSAATGWLVIDGLFGSLPKRRALALAASFALPLGLGISSCVFFAARAGFGQTSAPLLPDLGALVLAAAANRLLRKGALPKDGGPAAGRDASPLLRGALAVTFFCAAARFLLLTVAQPDGGWDAWAIWNLRARALFGAGDRLADAFSPVLSWSHPDYPLLLPLTVTRLWTYAGRWTTAAPAAVAGLSAVSGAAILGGTLAALRSPRQGLLAATILLGTPFFVKNGAAQYADVPVGVYYLAAAALLCLAEGKRRAGLAFAAGLAAGFAAWTKNEGLLFCAALAAGCAAVFAVGRLFRAGGLRLPTLAGFAAGLLPPLAAVVWFKLRLAPPSSLLPAGGLPELGTKLLDASRYAYLAGAFAESLLGRGAQLVGVPFLAVYAWAVGLRRVQGDRPVLAALSAAWGLTFAGFFLVYVVTPYDLRWHVSSSLDRLVLQLWPGFLLLFFLHVETPEAHRTST